MKNTDRKGFTEYVNEYVPFMEFITTTKGTIFLSICGYDGGNVFADGLEGNRFNGKMNIPFTDTKAIDKFIVNAAKSTGDKAPEVTYTEYCLASVFLKKK